MALMVEVVDLVEVNQQMEVMTVQLLLIMTVLFVLEANFDSSGGAGGAGAGGSGGGIKIQGCGNMNITGTLQAIGGNGGTVGCHNLIMVIVLIGVVAVLVAEADVLKFSEIHANHLI